MKSLSLLLILSLATLLASAQTPCDTIGGQAFTILEHPPKMNLTLESLETTLNSNLSGDLEGLENVEYIYVIYYVNCKGEDYDYTIATFKNGKTAIDSTSNFSSEISELLKTTLEFEPGYLDLSTRNKQDLRMVDAQDNLTIEYSDNRFHVMNEKEIKKHWKRKNKKKN